jgi:hypothetical protein
MTTESEQITLVDPTETEPERPDGACINWSDCGNLTPGGPETANMMCDECLDATRARGPGHDL